MAQPPHIHIDGAVYFVTTRLKEGQRFFTEHEARIVQRVLLDLGESNDIVLYAYVIMPDHLHILLKPITNGISKTMQLIKGRASRIINIQREPTGEAEASCTLNRSFEILNRESRGDFSRPAALWQKGYFDFTVFTEKKYKEKFNYIHHNPVKRGLVGKAEDFQYSSAGEYKEKYGEVYYQ